MEYLVQDSIVLFIFRLFSQRIHHSYIQYYLRFLCISRHFHIKGTIHYPARSEKRGQKPERDIILSRSFAVRIHKETNMLSPNPLSAHKRRKERDNNMSLLLCLRIRKGQYIITLMHCLSARKGQYYAPLFLLRFPAYFTRGTMYCPLIHFPSFI